MLHDTPTTALAQDTCPLCGPVSLASVQGRLVATRLDGRGVCACPAEDRLAREERVLHATLLAKLGL